VLLVISGLLVLDAGIAALGRRLGWTKPIAWLGPAFGIFTCALFSIVLLGSFGSGSRTTAALYEELATRMAAAGHPLDASAGPVITNFPIWMAETMRIPALALPDEPPRDVLSLANDARFKAKLLVLLDADSLHWPADLDAGVDGASCFRELDLGTDTSTAALDPLGDARAFEIVCP
jgi:hypothetical protein